METALVTQNIFTLDEVNGWSSYPHFPKERKKEKSNLASNGDCYKIKEL